MGADVSGPASTTGHLRGIPEPPGAYTLLGPRVAITRATGATHGLLLWHDCPVEGGWCAADPSLHTMTGTFDNLTLRASVYFPECCGLHGWVTDGKWTDA